MWVGGVADSQTWSKPLINPQIALKIALKIALFDLNFTSQISQISQKTWGAQIESESSNMFFYELLHHIS